MSNPIQVEHKKRFIISGSVNFVQVSCFVHLLQSENKIKVKSDKFGQTAKFG